jgi:hypothetical protein
MDVGAGVIIATVGWQSRRVKSQIVRAGGFHGQTAFLNPGTTTTQLSQRLTLKTEGEMQTFTAMFNEALR